MNNRPSHPATPDKSMPSTQAAKTMMVRRQPPQLEPSPLLATPHGLAQLGPESMVLWPRDFGDPHLRVRMERAFGIGLLSDGGVIAFDAPASLKGKVILHRLSSPSSAPAVYQDFVPSPFKMRACVLTGAAPEEFLLASPDSHYALERYHLAGSHDIQLEERQPLSGTDYQTLISLAGGVALFHRDGALIKVSFPAAQVQYKLPPTVTSVRHLAAGSTRELVWVSEERSVSLLHLGDPLQVLKNYHSNDGEVFHLSSSGSDVAVLFLAQAADGTQRKWKLVTLDHDANPKLHIEVEDTSQPCDRYVALGAGYVAVGGGESLAVWDSVSGRRLR